MKKTFALTHEKIKTPRLVEAIKHEVKKYLIRERKKDLPKGADYWDFDCRFGTDEANSNEIHVSEINKHIDQVEADNLTSFYLEILAIPAVRQVRDDEESYETEDDELED